MNKKKYSLFVDRKMVYLGDFDTPEDARNFIRKLPVRPIRVCIVSNY